MNTITSTYDLTTIHDSRKSFYGKAKVRNTITPDGELRIELLSYGTTVAAIIDGVPTIYDFYSATTTRHTKEFLLQHGHEATTKAQMLRDYVRN